MFIPDAKAAEGSARASRLSWTKNMPREVAD
jgi:hypothetical protein